ncbi:SMP-30/gluconolactonase/LRE family protein [Microvirga tunisiensis]|uniref:SMP-30/gluconolactonase/LRE family protein n=1 Tax=Microvirga tunisiensis TaxID=2108360 RepID=A0A5N7MC23_9HYPH|nr:SMP-30/gluconolactonase/LRE family protein [Microvirga tunisiensis]MPR06070.1 SMP-30/gluconolactonase/LRE family protein [Microvirga tunisiensis]MPR24405.1 SMP-30/gluconolactonase/LRE family protein [Microvirga tunisiensis]
MTSQRRSPVEYPDILSRRSLIKAMGAGAVVAGSGAAWAQTPAQPPSTVTNPPRDFGPGGAPTTYFTDPDVLTVDPLFNQYAQPNSAITRLWTGALWSEGQAWNAQGRYLVWSDIPNNRQMRWLEDDGRVSVFRMPSNNSNGNSFDFQGRQLSCEHLTRRVVRYELDGSVTVLADSFEGKRLNSPNDVVAHPDGSYWFTDPPYGGQLYEGAPDIQGGPSNAGGRLNPKLGQAAGIGSARRELPTNCYRVDPSGRVDLVVTEDQVPDPNGLCFSPDYKKLYVASTGKGPGDTGAGGKSDIHVFDVGTDNKLSNRRLFSDCTIDGVKCGPDGLRCDVDGNLWASSNAGRAVGYNGVTVWTPEGKLMGRIRLPEVCGNICFGGPKRNRLFMAASQSLYAVYVNTQGAGPG